MRLGALLHAWGRIRSTGNAGNAGAESAASGSNGAAAGAGTGSTSAAALKQRYLSAIDVFRDLPPAELERLARTTTMLTCPRGRTIFRAADASDTLFLLKKGRVQIVRETIDGKRLVTALLGPETFFGEMALLGQRFPRDSTAEIIEDAVVCVMSRRDVEQLIVRFPAVGLRFLEQVGARLVETQAMVEEFAFKSVPARLASVLLRLAELEAPAADESEQSSDDAAQPALSAPAGLAQAPVTVAITHQELADMVATYRETVTVALHQFREQGLVALGRRSVTVLDRKGLEAASQAEP